MPLLTTALAGFTFGLSLIVAIGAQNAFVLRQGLLRRHIAPVVAICVGSDLVLILAGAAGVGAAIAAHKAVLAVVTVAGAAVLLWYGISAARRSLRGTSGLTAASTSGGLRATLLTAVALTWLNPHVYLDTVVLLGSVSASYRSPLAFAAGAGLASIAWFSLLGFGARALAPAFARPVAWRVFDGLVAVVMLFVAGSLLLTLK